MELKEKLADLMAALKGDFLHKYMLFSSGSQFDAEAFLQQTLQFFGQLEVFNQKFIVSDAIPVSESFVNKFEEKIQELSTEDPGTFVGQIDQLNLFLNGFLLIPATRGGATVASIIPHPLNQEIVDTLLRPQPDIIDSKKMEIIDSGSAFDEETFKKHNQKLFFSRSLYREQLLKNVIKADRLDKRDCKKANQGIEDATADNFFDQLDAARVTFDDKIVPVIS